MATDFVFPEDSGTGAPSGDNVDAGNFAALAHAIGLVDFVDTGLGITNVSYGSSFDVNAGMCVVTDGSADEAQTTESRDQGVSYVVIADARSGISLSASGVNNVYLDVNLSNDDDISVVTGVPASQPYLKIAEIDNDAGTVKEVNRDPVLRNLHFLHNRRRLTTDSTIGESGYYTVDTSGGAKTETIASSAAVDGREINFKRVGGNDLTLNTEGSETIENGNEIVLTQDEESVTLVYDEPNTNWEVF